MDKIKAIFLDFDWTIFDHKSRSYIKEADDALNICKNQGIKLIINSARTYYSLQGVDAFKHVNFDGYAACNGLAAFTNEDVIYAHYINKKYVLKLIKICEKHHMSYLISTLRKSYIKNFNNDPLVLRFYQTFYEPYPFDINEYQNNNFDDIIAVQLFCKPEDDHIFKRMEHKVRINRFSDVCTEANALKASKSEAIQAILKYYDIPNHKAAAFGDGLNDIDMFQAVKYGICMGNGHKEAKNEAKFVTSDIDNHGILNGLKYLQLIK